MIKYFCETTILSATLSFAAQTNNPNLKKKLEIIQFKDQEIQLWIPDQDDIQLSYQSSEPKTPFPFWAKLWPAALALTEFIQDNPHWVQHKKVLELAAGLGLPSLYASHLASSVLCSDFDTDAVSYIKDNIELNSIKNMTAAKIDWTLLPESLEWDVLLMSDVNYDPDDFEVLFQLMLRILALGKTILLSTPQRLAGKPFIAALLPYCRLNEERWQEHVAINVLVLKK
jgi:predicted nicotinamide N-methyase